MHLIGSIFRKGTNGKSARLDLAVSHLYQTTVVTAASGARGTLTGDAEREDKPTLSLGEYGTSIVPNYFDIVNSGSIPLDPVAKA